MPRQFQHPLNSFPSACGGGGLTVSTWTGESRHHSKSFLDMLITTRIGPPVFLLSVMTKAVKLVLKTYFRV